MRPIDKFILHVVHNLFSLNEYSEKEINFLMNQFKEEADDLNIQISDEQLRKYIERFDQLKDSPKVTDKDLRKYSLAKLIRLVTASTGVEDKDDEEDKTPDVVYQDNGITIYNGSKEGNCIRYGNGEKWCITRGSFSGYRYSESKGYPTFYLAKNNNLSDDDKLSFVAIQVRDTGSESNRYVYTNRKNTPYESKSMSFSELLEEIPWLKNIPNIKNILKYIPLSKQEKINRVYKNSSISIREWSKLPYNTKIQYLVARQSSSNNIFSDLKNEDFVKNYLPKFPQIASFIAITPNVIDSMVLLSSLESFSNQDRRSITANLQDKIPSRFLSSETFPFEVKKLLVKLDKWGIADNERLYVTKDNSTIVKLEFKDDDIVISLYQAEDDFPNIKLNKRTSKYLLEYPELDKIPLKNLVKLVKEEIVDPNLINRILDNAKKDPNSAIIVKNIDGTDVILDSNSFSSFKIENGKLETIPFNSEEVQKLFNDSKDNEGFQQNAVSLFTGGDKNIPSYIDKEALKNIINSIPYNKRIIVDAFSNNQVILTPNQEGISFALMAAELGSFLAMYATLYGNTGSKYNGDYTDWPLYFSYLRATNQVYSDDKLKGILQGNGSTNNKIKFIASRPPVANSNIYKPAMNGDTALLINTADPRQSLKISDTSGKLIKANVPTSLARQLLGTGAQIAAPTAAAPAAAQPAAVGGAVRGRGRPAGVPNAPRPAAAAPAAPAEGEIRLTAIADRFPATFQQVPVANNRGASRRQNILGDRGRVVAVYESGNSAIYIIRLANNTNIASVVIQPGNSHFIVTSDNTYPLDSPSNLLQALQQRNLAEVYRYITNEYFERNPEHITEFKHILRKHINEKKMKSSQLKEAIREIIKQVLSENQPATAPSKPKEKPGPAVAPGKPSEKPKEPRRPLGNPKVKPAPKALKEEEMLKKIVARFKSKK